MTKDCRISSEAGRETMVASKSVENVGGVGSKGSRSCKEIIVTARPVIIVKQGS